MSTSGLLPEFLTGLEAFAQTLAARPDVALCFYRLKPPAPPERLAQHRGRLPAELLELAALTAGFSLAWEFLKSKEKGLINVDIINLNIPAPTVLWPASAYDARLGADCWAFRLDQAGTWLVVDSPDDLASVRLVFTPRGDAAAQPLGYSLAQYLHRALAAGFVTDWPLAESQASVRQAIKRIMTPLPASKVLQAGVRVESHAISQYCRGEVLQVHYVDPQGALSKGTFRARSGIYALIRFDLGYTYWQVADQLKPLPRKPDLYEQLRADPWLLVRWGETEGWETALRRLAVAWGPITGIFSGYVDSSWLVAAILRPLSLNEGAELLRRVAQGVQASSLDLRAPLHLPEAERARDRRRAPQWRRYNWEEPTYTPLRILVNGYCARVLVEPEEGREALALETLDELEAFGVWGEPQPFYHTRRLLVLNNDGPKIYFEDPSAELPGDYRIIRHSAF